MSEQQTGICPFSMNIRKKLFIVGIVTKNRKDSLLGLLCVLNEQAITTTDVIIVENGSNALSPPDFTLFSKLSVVLVKQKKSNIPHARNIILHKSIARYQWVMYIDDDCTPSFNWFREIKHFLKTRAASKHSAIQGISTSVPMKNIYAQASGALYALWFDTNTHGTSTSVLDTKCCLLNTSVIMKHRLYFDETLVYASDIDLGSRLIGCTKQPIYVFSPLRVNHEERQTMLTFISHRIRLSVAFQAVMKKHAGIVRGSPLNEKIQSLMRVSIPFHSKFMLLVGLSVAYVVSKITLFFKLKFILTVL